MPRDHLLAHAAAALANLRRASLMLALLCCLSQFLGCAATSSTSATPPPHTSGDPIVDQMRASAVPIDDLLQHRPVAAQLHAMLSSADVVALGEATHGQHESFQIKRDLTMHLVRHAGFRIVAYEASATSARACDDYISGRTADLPAAMSGLGMLIWNIHENAALLRDLREWNAACAPSERVRFIGSDVQDVQASATRLAALLRPSAPELAPRVESIAARLDAAIGNLRSGDRADYDACVRETIDIAERIASLPSDASRAEVPVAIREFQGGVQMFLTPGGRDRAMADVLLASLESQPSHTKTVLWAHNAHIARGQLGYLNSEELAMGGHLAKRLGSRFIAVGFAFGEGTFNALDRGPDGKWGFRPYLLDPPPVGSLEWPLARACTMPCLIGLREVTTSGPLQDWARSPHGQRWFGGYNVSPDARQTSSDAANLMPTTPTDEYDILLFLPRTTATHPSNPSRTLPPLTQPNAR